MTAAADHEISIVYEIASWSEVFETSDSRKHKSLAWVSLPIDRQSSGYQSLIDRFGPEAPAIYGAWCALVTIAGEAPKRGRLASSKGEPYSIQRIARMAFMPEEVFERLFEWAIRPEIAWLVPVKPPQPISTRSSIDRQPVDDRSTIELPNLTLPNPTLPIHTPSNDGGVGVDPAVVDDASESPRPPKGRSRKRKPTKSKPRSGKPRQYTDEFSRWWEAYPRKESKPTAADAFGAAISRIEGERDVGRESALEWLIERTAVFRRSVADRPPDKVPHPATWLNQDRWNDDLQTGGRGHAADPGVTYVPELASQFGEGF